jgi:hypothetical protein
MAGKKKKNNQALRENKPVEAVMRADKKPFIIWLENRTNQFWIIGLLTFLLYGNTLFNQYALDDGMVLTDNKLYRKASAEFRTSSLTTASTDQSVIRKTLPAAGTGHSPL